MSRTSIFLFEMSKGTCKCICKIIFKPYFVVSYFRLSLPSLIRTRARASVRIFRVLTHTVLDRLLVIDYKNELLMGNI